MAISLGLYVKKRTGLPLGAKGSLGQMLRRAFGASSFDRFWVHWNPIFSYYLGYRLYRPLARYIPAALALWLTFVGCGALHDAVTMLVRGSSAFLFTPWFALMGLLVAFSKNLPLGYGASPFWLRALINLTLIALCLALVLALGLTF